MMVILFDLFWIKSVIVNLVLKVTFGVILMTCCDHGEQLSEL